MPSTSNRAESRWDSAYTAVSLILSRYLSDLNAAGLLSRALREAGLKPDAFELSDIPSVVPRLDRGIRLFLDPREQRSLRGDLEELAKKYRRADVPPQTIPISSEVDISAARLSIRALCVEQGMRALHVQRVVTIVSELARNIVEYTPGGTLRIAFRSVGNGQVASIEAQDEGPGISNLDSILAGRYRSRVGLGKGLLGVKRLADSFDVHTGKTGTRVAVEVSV